jgi:hypothetical protein
MENTGNIYSKLLEIQKLNIKIEKDSKSVHSMYPSLNEVLDKVRKQLNDRDILILQEPTDSGLTTTLRDTTDGSEVKCFVPFVGAVDMQKLGGAITYARRYSLVTILCLEAEDDDGETAISHGTGATNSLPTIRR